MPQAVASSLGLREAPGRTPIEVLIELDRAHYDYEGYLAIARSQLEETAWEAAWSEGRAMIPEAAIDYALSEAPPPTSPPKEDKAALSERELETCASSQRASQILRWQRGST